MHKLLYKLLLAVAAVGLLLLLFLVFEKRKFSLKTKRVSIETIKKSANPNNPKKSPLSYFEEKTSVSVDDDPIMGKKDAPLTLIEFSDFECSKCKRFFQETLPKLKENYIGVGKLKLVYRDFPTNSHNPLAIMEATAADCSREQGGDLKYFEYHDEIFKTTRSGGKGLEISNLFSIADNLKLNPNLFKECLESERYRDEISKDYTDGINNGVTGTPTFFLGLTTNTNSIKGFKILGPMSYEAFSILIEELLKLNEKNFIQ